MTLIHSLKFFRYNISKKLIIKVPIYQPIYMYWNCKGSTPDNTMANRKNNDPHQTIHWPTGKTMIHTRQYNGRQEKQ